MTVTATGALFWLAMMVAAMASRTGMRITYLQVRVRQGAAGSAREGQRGQGQAGRWAGGHAGGALCIGWPPD